jgi:DNA repair protein RecO (recombination protein O)
MSKRRVDQEPGYVLHTYPYKETSLIVEAFTRRLGRVALLARGARRPRSTMRGVLLSFHPLRFSWSGSADLANLMGAEWAGGIALLGGRGLMCGFYVNELLLKLVPRDDPHEGLFDAYADTLAALASGDVSVVLRNFEKRLLGELGYAPMLQTDAASRPIDPERLYRYEPDHGPVPANGSPGGQRGVNVMVSGRTLLDVAAGDYARPETREEARALMRALIGERLHGQALHTRSILMELNEL